MLETISCDALYYIKYRIVYFAQLFIATDRALISLYSYRCYSSLYRDFFILLSMNNPRYFLSGIEVHATDILTVFVTIDQAELPSLRSTLS
jgi:hypothetical protein